MPSEGKSLLKELTTAAKSASRESPSTQEKASASRFQGTSTARNEGPSATFCGLVLYRFQNESEI